MHLVAKATRMRTILPSVIFHLGHGSQYTSEDFREILRISKMAQSMGKVGTSYDNAMAESLWASLKKELIYQARFKTREEAKTKIFDWIHWYNHKRIHSSINYLSPIAFEALADARVA